MQIRQARAGDLRAMAELAGRLQADPTSAIPYLGVAVDGIENELAEIDWRSVSALAFDHDRLTGWLVGDVDGELGRVFWLGPFVAEGDWDDVASRLYTGCSKLLRPETTEEEMAVDSRFVRCQSWAAGQGFVAETGSLALVLDSDPWDLAPEIRAVRDDDLAALGPLHEELFPGTHTTGRQLVEGRDEDHVRLVADIDGVLAGYVAFEVQPDGAGYLDFLGVSSDFRRRGLGTQLVRAAVASLGRRGAAPIHLTVREDNGGARRLYGSFGFAEERVIRPLRKGFSIACLEWCVRSPGAAQGSAVSPPTPNVGFPGPFQAGVCSSSLMMSPVVRPIRSCLISATRRSVSTCSLPSCST
jgi:ribosomal-protein-alanine N-acetyltransferase